MTGQRPLSTSSVFACVCGEIQGYADRQKRRRDHENDQQHQHHVTMGVT